MASKKLRWLIIYSDRSSYSNEDGPWQNAPEWDIQIILEANNEVGHVYHTQGDYYFLINDEIISVDETGAIDYLINVLNFARIHKIGAPTLFQIVKDGQIVDFNGMTLLAQERIGLKVGRMLSNNHYRKLMADAHKKDFQPKSAWLNSERRIDNGT